MVADVRQPRVSGVCFLGHFKGLFEMKMTVMRFNPQGVEHQMVRIFHVGPTFFWNSAGVGYVHQ